MVLDNGLYVVTGQKSLYTVDVGSCGTRQWAVCGDRAHMVIYCSHGELWYVLDNGLYVVTGHIWVYTVVMGSCGTRQWAVCGDRVDLWQINEHLRPPDVMRSTNKAGSANTPGLSFIQHPIFHVLFPKFALRIAKYENNGGKCLALMDANTTSTVVPSQSYCEGSLKPLSAR